MEDFVVAVDDVKLEESFGERSFGSLGKAQRVHVCLTSPTQDLFLLWMSSEAVGGHTYRPGVGCSKQGIQRCFGKGKVFL